MFIDVKICCTHTYDMHNLQVNWNAYDFDKANFILWLYFYFSEFVEFVMNVKMFYVFFLQQIWKFVYTCLETMSKSKLHSIAIPAMGTGIIGYPPWRVAAMMYNIVDKFSDNNKSNSIREVKLVVYPSDTKTVKVTLTWLSKDLFFIILKTPC